MSYQNDGDSSIGFNIAVVIIGGFFIYLGWNNPDNLVIGLLALLGIWTAPAALIFLVIQLWKVNKNSNENK